MNDSPAHLCEIHSLGSATGEWLVLQPEVPCFQVTHTRVAGYSEARHGYEFVRHNPAFSQILACIDGEGEVLVDGTWQTCGAGHAYLTAPRALCAYHATARSCWRICWVQHEESHRLHSLEAGQTPRLIQAEVRGLHLAIEGLCREAGFLAEANFLEHWGALVNRQVLRILDPVGNVEPRLSRLWAAVRQDFGGSWDLNRMAIEAGLSPESLRRLCLQHLGRPPLSYLTHLRMKYAADLLSCSGEKISSISRRVGYGDEFAFSTAFKREWGVPPSRFRSRENPSV